MGIKENFLQALNELTGGVKTAKYDRKKMVDNMRRAVDIEPADKPRNDAIVTAMFEGRTDGGRNF